MKNNFMESSGRNLFRFLSLIIVSLLITSCHHKDLEFDFVDMRKAIVVFDWQNSPDANPESMGVYLYYTSPELENPNLLFEFPNKDGGEINIPVGNFSGIAFNSDNTDWVIMKNTENVDEFEISTHSVSSLNKAGLITRSIPRPADALSERMAETPGMAWSVRNDGLTLSPDDNVKTYTFCPNEAVCHYSVDVLNIENIESIDGLTTDGVITGMAEGYKHGKGKSTATKVSHPITLSKSTNDNSLHSEFLTFGEPSENAGNHYLSLYLILNDGQKKYYEFNVTDQIRDAKDPHHVHIVVEGPHLPKTHSSEGGLNPTVDDWDSENIDLKM